jgi:hypothetical protein
MREVGRCNTNNNKEMMVQTNNMSSMSELFELLDKLQSSRLGRRCMKKK